MQGIQAIHLKEISLGVVGSVDAETEAQYFTLQLHKLDSFKDYSGGKKTSGEGHGGRMMDDLQLDGHKGDDCRVSNETGSPTASVLEDAEVRL